jgi:Lamin Tail Domain
VAPPSPQVPGRQGLWTLPDAPLGPLCVRAQGARLRLVTPFANTVATSLLLIGTAFGSSPGVSPVKVNEMALGPAGFVELRNTGATSADVGGWSIQSCSGRTPQILATIPPSTVLLPGEYFLIVGSAFSGTAPNSLVVDTVDGSGVIARNRHGAHTDSVGLTSSSPCREDGPAIPCNDSSLGRDSTSRDTDRNEDDFACQIPTPGETNQ